MNIIPVTQASIMVTPPEFDNIGAILSSLNVFYQEVAPAHIFSEQTMQNCNTLYINCASWCCEKKYSRKAKTSLRKFVEKGGTLYLSDAAGYLIHGLLPSLIEFDQNTDSGRFSCEVQNQSLRNVLGNRINLHFETPGWLRVLKVDPSIEILTDVSKWTYLSSDCGYAEGNSPGKEAVLPDRITLSASIKLGQGEIIYSAFHHQKQMTQAEAALEIFMLLRPILKPLMQNARAYFRSLPGYEAGSYLTPTMPKRSFTFQSTGQKEISILANWLNMGRIALIITDPTGRIAGRIEGATSPLYYRLPSQQAGNWTLSVESVQVFNHSIPFTVCIL